MPNRSAFRHSILTFCVLSLTWLGACGPNEDPLVQLAVQLLLAPGGRTGHDPGPPARVAASFVNWETPHVHPLDLTPDGARLLAVNTPDARLEILDATASPPVVINRVGVGLDPVAVRARTSTEAWVVNHVSDTVSIVDLSTSHVVRTLSPGDEPTDVGFAAGRAFVVCSQLNRVVVYDLANLDAAPSTIDIAGEDPRALAVSPDGTKVYVAIFESGNKTTLVPFFVVSDPAGPYGGANPVPDFVSGLMPTSEVTGPATSVIVRKDARGAWLDANGMDWSGIVTWDVHDHDLAVIDAQSLGVSYVTSLMNLNMAMDVRPDGAVTVVGTDATNEVRFEPAVAGHFIHSLMAVVPPDLSAPGIVDLNPHLADAYQMKMSRVSPDLRALSVADPRGIAWSPDSQFAFVTGLGSNNVAKLDAAGNRVAQVDVGQGPTGVRFDASRNRLYVLSKFEFGLSVIDPDTMTESARVSLFDPTPSEIRDGRPFLYDARLTSGLGVTACAACHVDGRMDQLAWDLGNPATGASAFNQTCDRLLIIGEGSPIDCEDFHPVKGPMTTQTLQGVIGTEPLHWRGDRDSLAEFNPAFVNLDGADRELTPEEMARFEAFLATITFAPNPFRLRDDSLPEKLGDDDPRRGFELFMTELIDARASDADDVVIDPLLASEKFVSCNRCHQIPTGTTRHIVPGPLLIEPQSMKVPQLRNAFEKTGFSRFSKNNNRGFGYTHDGAFSSVEEFLSIDVFRFGAGEAGAQKRRDVVSFVICFSTDTHAGVGWTVTLNGGPADAAAQADIDSMLALADAGQVGLVVRARPGDQTRGYAYTSGGQFQSDRAGETVNAATLRGPASAGHEITWLVVPLGSQTRLGIDPDGDFVLDGD